MLDSTHEIYSSIVNQMAEGVLYLDADDTIRICNPAAESIRKVKAERIVGRTVFDIHPAVAHESIRELLSALKTGTGGFFDAQFQQFCTNAHTPQFGFEVHLA